MGRTLGLQVSAGASVLAMCFVRAKANKQAAKAAAKKAKRMFKEAGAKDMVEKADDILEFLTTGQFPQRSKGAVKEKASAAQTLGLQYSDMQGPTLNNTR